MQQQAGHAARPSLSSNAVAASPSRGCTPSRVPRAHVASGHVYDEASGPADRGHAFAASGGSANAIALPSGSGTFTWRTPFE
jgi:hypothetical protein